MHYMMEERYSGVPDGWPDWAKFPSTIDFDIVLPSGTRNCQASWPNGTLPEGEFECTRAGDGKKAVQAEEKRGNGPIQEGQTLFSMTRWFGLGERRPEMSYVLGVREGRQGNVTYSGAQCVTANTNSEPTSYMTCMLGRPLDGERCHIRSYMSVDRDLVIEAFEMPGIGL
ncbi:hypothetical protein K505DRAFT_270598 [Melanomma pulvis-pyrius CBS 109.77]|uniref:Uncharacterized protein n=1 Tax=Melanomma pulvis-pyrius CBS 109.77 TaxID=1314802 RepID=A0A6A6XKB1_9PLEO|nr:hypothetical protein K505DRAFT_270598 [Melanomma pulvis-pyrius CBS 109.77]